MTQDAEKVSQLSAELLAGTGTSGVADYLSVATGKALGKADLEYHQGYVIAWDSAAQTNQVKVLGRVFDDLPVLTSAGMISIAPGSTVAILKYKTSYFIIGRIVAQSTGFVNPQFPLVLYPQFVPPGTPGNAEFFRGNATQLTNWAGMAIVSHPFIVVNGLFGAWTGTNTTRYELHIDGVSVGAWTETTAVGPVIRGPFDVSNYIGTAGFYGSNINAIEVVVGTSTGTGTYLFQLYGCFFQGY